MVNRGRIFILLKKNTFSKTQSVTHMFNPASNFRAYERARRGFFLRFLKPNQYETKDFKIANRKRFKSQGIINGKPFSHLFLFK